MKFLTVEAGKAVPVRGQGLPETAHVFDQDSIDAVNAALAAERPLLVRGEPGTGKSQLARAAASSLGRLFLSSVIDARTEARDLLWSFDAVARLAQAQMQQALGATSREDVEANLDEKKFVKPGPLWWAFSWQKAKDQAKLSQAPVPIPPPGWQPEDGAVVLIDEIDKADSAVPNGLLECLGQLGFAGPGGEWVGCTGQARPLILITTNEERALPDAFLRRCLVLQLAWPKDEDKLVSELVLRGEAHFPKLSPEVLKSAARMLAADRQKVAQRRLYAPGGAEYLDLLRALQELAEHEQAEPEKLLQRIGRFVLDKHPADPEW
ncbi:MAG: MoxR family ATPase [Thermoanaerobaculia bacterium]